METSPTMTPVARTVANIVIPWVAAEDALVIGLSGPQGSGKTTAIKFLEKIFQDDLVALSIDDFYLTKKQRQSLAEKVSPLFETRGPPGTHDIELLGSTIDAILHLDTDRDVYLPIFDKKRDDRLPKSEWRKLSSRPRAIVLEGWCVGANLPDDFVSGHPVNDVERRDTDQAWRNYQANALSTQYASLWSRIDKFIHIHTDSFEVVKSWRIEQEADNLGLEPAKMSDDRKDWVSEFVKYYQRITESMIAGIKKPGTRITIDTQRRVIGISETN